MTPDPLTDLYRTHNGPPPRPALKAVLLEGSSPHEVRRIRAGWTLASRLAADQRLGISRRRTACAASPKSDPWLTRLVADLALHRTTAEFWRLRGLEVARSSAKSG
jgi:hypothetical protein